MLNIKTKCMYKLMCVECKTRNVINKFHRNYKQTVIIFKMSGAGNENWATMDGVPKRRPDQRSPST